MRGKSTVTGRAGKRALSAVRERVTFQRVGRQERLAAQTTGVPPLVGVTVLVSRQIAAAQVVLLAHVAGKRSIIAVHAQVTFQRMGSAELPAAYVTRVSSFN